MCDRPVSIPSFWWRATPLQALGAHDPQNMSTSEQELDKTEPLSVLCGPRHAGTVNIIQLYDSQGSQVASGGATSAQLTIAADTVQKASANVNDIEYPVCNCQYPKCRHVRAVKAWTNATQHAFVTRPSTITGACAAIVPSWLQTS